jgi:sigma-B regulation protein RsbU (phosphoserine phosphatase)
MLLEEEGLPEPFYRDLRNIHSSGKRLLELITHYFDERTVADPKNLHELQHELRTPVNHIIGYSDLLQDHAAESGLDRLAPDLQRIRDAACQWLALMEEHLIPVEAVADPNFAEDSVRAPLLTFVTPGIGFHAVRPRLADEAAHWKARILVVDDDAGNRDLLARRLQRYGATVTAVEDGLRALTLLRKEQFDLVLLDLVLPGLDGYQVLVKVKADQKLRDVPVIMISGLDQENGIARCLEAGAEDYLTKPFNSVFLKARIGACLEKKHWRDQEQATYQALLKSQQHLASELAEAAGYVKSLLPVPMDGTIKADWRFIPSSELGGDAFGYDWVDQEHFAIFLLDVCSHGVGAALLSISVMNVLRSRNLPGVDFRKPGEVLAALNRVFAMETQNNLYFTMWYGVVNNATRQLSYSSAGHPPAILVTGADRAGARVEKLKTPGSPVGTFSRDVVPSVQHTLLQPFNHLFVFSDGAYEITRPDGSMLTLEEFIRHLAERTGSGVDALQATISFLESNRGTQVFEDDLALVELSVPV